MINWKPDFCSRRTAIRTLVGSVSVGFVPWVPLVKADEKMSPQQAQYQGTPNGIYSCSNCSLFQRPNSCKVVSGEVSEDGWCRVFAMVD